MFQHIFSMHLPKCDLVKKICPPAQVFSAATDDKPGYFLHGLNMIHFTSCFFLFLSTLGNNQQDDIKSMFVVPAGCQHQPT
jgi:hypothetical protein